jgi:hypothetical protein
MFFLAVMILVFFIGAVFFERGGFTAGLTIFLTLSVCAAIVCSVLEETLADYSRRLVEAYRHITTKGKFM